MGTVSPGWKGLLRAFGDICGSLSWGLERANRFARRSAKSKNIRRWYSLSVGDGAAKKGKLGIIGTNGTSARVIGLGLERLAWALGTFDYTCDYLNSQPSE